MADGRGAAWTEDREKAALARDIARLCPASPGAGVIGAPSVAAQPAFAALANGILVNAADDDDTHKRALLHVGSVVVPAALATLNRHPVDPRNITRITNETDRIVTTHCSSKEVGSVMAACVSVPYCIAISAVDRRLTQAQFALERVNDSLVR